MPELSRFLGIVILMYWNDHNPPHIHAKYSGYEALVSFDGKILEGELPKRAKQHVLEWVQLNEKLLRSNWQRAHNNEPLLKIAPLE